MRIRGVTPAAVEVEKENGKEEGIRRRRRRRRRNGRGREGKVEEEEEEEMEGEGGEGGRRRRRKGGKGRRRRKGRKGGRGGGRRRMKEEGGLTITKLKTILHLLHDIGNHLCPQTHYHAKGE